MPSIGFGMRLGCCIQDEMRSYLGVPLAFTSAIQPWVPRVRFSKRVGGMSPPRPAPACRGGHAGREVGYHGLCPLGSTDISPPEVSARAAR